MAAEQASDPVAAVRDRLNRLIASLQHPQERRIGYGNVRHEYSEWGEGDERYTNIAVIYEVPGGSTCQFNVSYNHKAGQFTYLDWETGERVETTSPEQVLRVLEAELHAIPARRHESLLAQVERWLQDGMSRSDVFAQLNKLLQAEFLGGRINNRELGDAVQHVVRRVSQAAR